MRNFVPRVLVGKASGAASTTQTAGSTLNLATVVAGDLYLVDENLVVLDAAAAAAAQTVIVARGRSAGKVLLSSPITRTRIRKNGYTFQAAASAVAQVTNFANLGLAAGKEYRLTVVIKDDLRVIANRQNRVILNHSTRAGSAFVIADELNRMVANFNKQRGVLSLITATVNGTTGITLTAKPILTESINDYEYVTFEASFTEVTAGVEKVALLPSSETKGQGGQGLAVQVRQLERAAFGHLGITDLRNVWDRPTPAFAASDSVAGGGYDVWHVLHTIGGQGMLQEVMSSPVQTTIAVATGSAQKTAFATLLNSFVAGTTTTPPDGE